MIGKNVIEEKPITNAEALKILEKSKKEYEKEEKEIGYELEQSLKYAKKFAKLSEKKSKEKVEQLVNLGLPEKVAVEIVNIMPESEETIKNILHKKTEFDDINKILEILKA